MLNLQDNLDLYHSSLSKQIEPHFEYANSRNISIETLCSSQTQLEYFDNRIILQPKELTSHVRKIGLLLQLTSKQDALFASLVDFFTIVKERAQAIKKRLLISSRLKLDKAQFDYLVSHFSKTNLTTNEILNNVSERLLFPPSQQHSFINQVAEIHVGNNQPNENTTENELKITISDYLENSQLDLAFELLEEHLSENSHHLEMGELLMQLYISTNEFKRFSNLHKEVKIHNPNLPHFWQETADHFIARMQHK